MGLGRVAVTGHGQAVLFFWTKRINLINHPVHSVRIGKFNGFLNPELHSPSQIPFGSF